MIREHGERYTQPFVVNNGKTVYHKNMQWCSQCGAVDLLNFPNFDTDHGAHAAKFIPSHGAFVEIPKTFKKAA